MASTSATASAVRLSWLIFHRRGGSRSQRSNSAGEDEEEGGAGPALLSVPSREDAALVIEADPEACGHVTPEGDLEDRQHQAVPGEDAGLF